MSGLFGEKSGRDAAEPTKSPNQMVWIMPLVFGAVVTLAVTQWMAQQRQLATLTQMVVDLQAPEIATRRAPPALAALPTAPAAAAAVAAAPVPVPAPASVSPDLLATSLAVPLSTADKIRELTSVTFNTAPSLDDDMMRRARRMETLAIIDAGVQELVAAVVSGDYEVHTNYEDEYFSGRIHFAFVGNQEDQTDLEQFIAAAAEQGIIAHGPSVVDGNGLINGHIMLFDLVERALESGTLQEQEAGRQMQELAVRLLAEDDYSTEVTAAGDRYYTVEIGDSLAYIALQFYGNTNDFTRIFEANRDVLVRPDLINVGQRLLIPEA